MSIVWSNVTIQLGALKPWEDNPRFSTKAQAKRLLKSWDELGQFQTIAVGPTGEVYDGHQRLSALLTVHGPEYTVDARQSDRALTDEERRRIVFAANAPAGNWDSDALASFAPAEQVLEWAGMDALAWGEAKREAAMWGEMLESVKPAEDVDAEPQVDRAEELREKWGVERGDLFKIGEHRLLCGDSTVREDVERVTGGEKAELCFTSPPYAEQRKQQYGGTPEEEYWRWFKLIVEIMPLSDFGCFVLNIKPNAREYQRSLYVFDLVCAMVRELKWFFVDEFTWLRTGIPQQVVHRFKNAFEPCYWFARSKEYKWYPRNVMHESNNVPIALGAGAGDTNAARRQGKGGGAIQGNKIESGMAYPSNVLDFKQNADALGHPAAFPIELPSFFVKAMSSESDLIYEPFAGSGTTLVACQNLSRRCRAIEISPAYVAVCLERMATAFPELTIEKV